MTMTAAMTPAQWLEESFERAYISYNDPFTDDTTDDTVYIREFAEVLDDGCPYCEAHGPCPVAGAKTMRWFPPDEGQQWWYDDWDELIQEWPVGELPEPVDDFTTGPEYPTAYSVSDSSRIAS